MPPRRRRFPKPRADGFKGPFEPKIAAQLVGMGVRYEYESIVVPYVLTNKRYVPDFILPNGIIVEVKGYFVSSDRTKLKEVKKQHPDLDIRLVFWNPNTKIGKKSKTTYAMWCETHGFPYAAGSVPPAWVNEPVNRASLRAIQRLKKERSK